jgi:60 kDa SS-A/Ro ribonucleoprotein
VKYEKHFNQNTSSQNEPIPGKNQIKNSAGGFSFEVDLWMKLDRFLILGTEGGSYYSSEKKLTIKSANAIIDCLKIDGLRTVDRIVEISDSGRAPKNDPAIFALAMALKLGNDETRKVARNAVSKVCRTGTHLFSFARAIKSFGGWGRGTRNAVASWYNSMDIHKLAFQVVKYQQRDGWSHRDLIRLSHLKTTDATRNAIYRWVVKDEIADDIVPIIQGFEKVKKASSANVVANLVREYRLPHECIPTQFKNEMIVQEALLNDMPLTAMIRNLGNMTKSGLLVPLSTATSEVIKRLGNIEMLREGRIHPIKILTALLTYKMGRGIRGKGTWNPVTAIIDALDEAFYESFKHVEPTGKRILLAMDVSGSMDNGTIAGVPGLSPRLASAAMAMAIARVEKNFDVICFSSGSSIDGHHEIVSGVTSIDISPRQRLDDVVNKVRAIPFGGTDCSLPMIYAQAKGMQVDAFIVLTDNETWAGKIHPSQALKKYRRSSGIASKSVVCGMVSNEFSIADPADSGMMDVVGFDSNVPSLISDFIR